MRVYSLQRRMTTLCVLALVLIGCQWQRCLDDAVSGPCVDHSSLPGLDALSAHANRQAAVRNDHGHATYAVSAAGQLAVLCCESGLGKYAVGSTTHGAAHDA